MIAKHVAMQSLKRSDFAGLVKYILCDLSKNERVGQVSVTNCQSDSPDVAITEIMNTQAQNTRAVSDKTYHLIVSFRAGENPDEATLKAIEARLCEALGYGEHQRISAVHNDTDNLHIHIAINKIHPTRITIHNAYYDHKKLGQLCAKLEREFGLEPDNHQAHKSPGENRAADMEHHAGVESLVGWIQRVCINQFQSAQFWKDLHQVMQANGLELHARGSGLVITSADGTTVKASSIGRDYAKKKLEARFGPFEPSLERHGASSPVRQYDKKPIRLEGNTSINTVALYARYQTVQQNISAARMRESERARDKKNRAIEAAKRNGRLKRAAITLVDGAGPGKKILYALASKTLTDDLKQIHKQYRNDRQTITDQYRRRAWADWLRAAATEGDAEALVALRAREAACAGRIHNRGNTVSGNGPGKGSRQPAQTHPKQDSITKQGTIIYRVGTTTVRDDGAKLSVSRGTSQEGLLATLQMAMQRYGHCIHIQGSATFKEHIVQAAAAAKLSITFDDAVVERRRQECLQQVTQNTTQHTSQRPTQHPTQQATTKESKHAQSDQASRGRSAHSSVIRSGTSSARSAIDVADSARGVAKPNIGKIGRQPPPQSKNRLRNLSELGVVCESCTSNVLLPRHVPGHLEQQRTTADHGLRRHVSGPGLIGVPGSGADQYIVEREQKRRNGYDIPKHVRYHEQAGTIAYAGIRTVNGDVLALLQKRDEIMVLPIDAATARRIKRMTIGTAVTVTAKGGIRAKGRSR